MILPLPLATTETSESVFSLCCPHVQNEGDEGEAPVKQSRVSSWLIPHMFSQGSYVAKK